MGTKYNTVYGDFPEDIQRIIKKRVEEAGNIYNPTTHKGSATRSGGFDWIQSYEESKLQLGDFWCKIIDDENYYEFYELYPKDEVKQISFEPYVYEALYENQKYKITIEKI